MIDSDSDDDTVIMNATGAHEEVREATIAPAASSISSPSVGTSEELREVPKTQQNGVTPPELDTGSNQTGSSVVENVVSSTSTADASTTSTLDSNAATTTTTPTSSSSSSIASLPSPSSTIISTVSDIGVDEDCLSSPITETMDDDDFLATLEAYERGTGARGGRSRSITEQYIPPPIAAKLAAASGQPLPPPPTPKTPEEQLKEGWQKAEEDYKELKASKGKWRPAKKVWDVNEERIERERAAVAAAASIAIASPSTPSSLASFPSPMGQDAHLNTAEDDTIPEESISPEEEEEGWKGICLRWGDALIEPNSAISGFANVGRANAAVMRRLSMESSPRLNINQSANNSPTKTLASSSSSPSSPSPRTSFTEDALLKAYLLDMAIQFYRQSSSGTRLVKHSRYSFPKPKLVKLNWETGVLTWGSGHISMREVRSMKFHRFSGSSLPSDAPTTSTEAAHIAAQLHAKELEAAAAATSSTSSSATTSAAILTPAEPTAPSRSIFSSSSSDSSTISSPTSSFAKSRLQLQQQKVIKPAAADETTSPKTLLGLFTPPTVAAAPIKKVEAPKGHFLFSLFTAQRSLQLDAPTAYDREVWLLGLYHFHQSFVLGLKNVFPPEMNEFGISHVRSQVGTNEPVKDPKKSDSEDERPIECINFEVLPSGELHVLLHKGEVPSTAATSAPNGSTSPTINSAAGLNSPTKVSFDSPVLHPSSSLTSPPSSPPIKNGLIDTNSPSTLPISQLQVKFQLNQPWFRTTIDDSPATTAASSSSSPTTTTCPGPSPAFLFHVSSGRASLMKHSRSGKPKQVELKINTNGILSWRGKETLNLAEAVDVVPGKTTRVFLERSSGGKLDLLHPKTRCFSIIMPTRTLDLELIPKPTSINTTSVEDECEEERNAWVENLKRMIEGFKKSNKSSTAAKTTTDKVDDEDLTGVTMEVNPLAISVNGASQPSHTKSSLSSTSSSLSTSSSSSSSHPTASISSTNGALPQGWRKSFKSTELKLVAESDDDSDSDSDADDDSDSDSDEDDAKEEQERAIAQQLLQHTLSIPSIPGTRERSSGSAPPPVPILDEIAPPTTDVTARSDRYATSLPTPAVDDSDSDDESSWEKWEDGASLVLTRTNSIGLSSSTPPPPPPPSAAPSTEDTTLTSLLRGDDLSAIHIPPPLTSDQLTIEELTRALDQRDQEILSLRAQVQQLLKEKETWTIGHHRT